MNLSCPHTLVWLAQLIERGDGEQAAAALRKQSLDAKCSEASTEPGAGCWNRRDLQHIIRARVSSAAPLKIWNTPAAGLHGPTWMDVIAATMGNMMRERDEQMVTLLTGRADLSAEQLKTAFREVTPECTPRLNAQ